MAYVYGHYKADTNELFYIGKGTGKRAWIMTGRSEYWQRVANKHGVVVKILEDALTDGEALAKETHLIEQIGLSNLANTQPGGKGNTSETARVLWERPEFRQKVSDTKRKTRKLLCGHIDTYKFPNGKKTCRVCFRDSVKTWRHKNGICKPRKNCDCSHCSPMTKHRIYPED
jgi:hypothetical protein